MSKKYEKAGLQYDTQVFFTLSRALLFLPRSTTNELNIHTFPVFPTLCVCLCFSKLNINFTIKKEANRSLAVTAKTTRNSFFCSPSIKIQLTLWLNKKEEEEN
jgi:hypothetical protein